KTHSLGFRQKAVVFLRPNLRSKFIHTGTWVSQISQNNSGTLFLRFTLPILPKFMPAIQKPLKQRIQLSNFVRVDSKNTRIKDIFKAPYKCCTGMRDAVSFRCLSSQ